MAAEKRDTVDVTIRIDKAHQGHLDTIVQTLRDHGLANIERHDRFLIVNGTVRAEKVPELGSVKGVASVREDRSYRAQ